MLLGLLAVSIAAAITLYDNYERGWDRWRLAGQIWAEWVHALDRAEIPAAWAGGDWTAVRDNLYGGPSPDLPVSGLGGDSGLDVGISIADVPMRFAYVELPPAPDLPETYCASPGLIGAPPEEQCLRVGAARLRPAALGRLDAVRRGIIDGGLRTVAMADPAGNLRGPDAITDFEDVLETRFGGPFTHGDLVAVAHISIPRNDRALHHRAPAGRPDLAGMQVDLDMGANDMVVEGEPPSGVAPEDSPDIEADGLRRIGEVDVHFAARVTSSPDDLEAAVRADFVVVGSLSLVSDRLEWAHEIGARGGAISGTEDEVLRIINGDFASAEVTCDRVDAGEHCVTAADAEAANLDTALHLEVHREQGAADPDGSGVQAGTSHVGTLDVVSGVCHGCVPF